MYHILQLHHFQVAHGIAVLPDRIFLQAEFSCFTDNCSLANTQDIHKILVFRCSI